MKRRQFIKLFGGAVIVLLAGGAVEFKALEVRAQGMSVEAEILRLVLRWFIKVRSGRGPNVAALRQRMELVTWIIPGPAGDTKTIQLDAGGVTAFRVTRPASRDGHHVIYLHGGMYVFGSISHYRDFLWRIAEATQAQILWIDYRLAPEHPFPAALDDVVAAYRWLLAGGADPRRITIMGDSSGGALAFATMIRLRDEGVALPAAIVSLSPWTDLAMTGASSQFNAEADPMLNTEQLRYTAECYLAGADPRSPYASPLYGDPTGWPRSLIQVGGDEILLDDAVRMAQKMRAAGSNVELQVWPHMPHVWQLFARFLPEGRRAIEQIGAFVRSAIASATAREHDRRYEDRDKQLAELHLANPVHSRSLANLRTNPCDVRFAPDSEHWKFVFADHDATASADVSTSIARDVREPNSQ